MAMGYIVYREDLADRQAVLDMVNDNPAMYPMGTAIQAVDGSAWIIDFNDGVDVRICQLCVGNSGCGINLAPFKSGDLRETNGFEKTNGVSGSTVVFNDPSTTATDGNASDSLILFRETNISDGIDHITNKVWIARNEVAIYPNFRFNTFLSVGGGDGEGFFEFQINPSNGDVLITEIFEANVTWYVTVHDTMIEFGFQMATQSGDPIKSFYEEYIPAWGDVWGEFNGAAEGSQVFENIEHYYDTRTLEEVEGCDINYSGPLVQPNLWSALGSGIINANNGAVNIRQGGLVVGEPTGEDLGVGNVNAQAGYFLNGAPTVLMTVSEHSTLIDRLDVLETQVVLLGGTI